MHPTSSPSDSGTVAPERQAEPRRILAVRLDNLGDVVLLTPALRALRQRYPDAHLALLASAAGARAAPLLPWVDEVFVLDALWQQLSPDGADWYGDIAAISRLRQARFDAAFIFTSWAQSPLPPAYFCHLAGIPVRVGESREFGGATLTTTVEPGPDEEHQAVRNLRLVTAAGIPPQGDHLELAVPPPAAYAAQRLLREAGGDPLRPYAVIAPGASARSRRWPAERFGAVVAGLRRLGLASVVVGGPNDHELAATVLAVSREAAGPGVGVPGADGEAPVGSRGRPAPRVGREAAGPGVGVPGADGEAPVGSRGRPAPRIEAAGGDLPPPTVDLSGRTSVPEMAALVAGAALVVTNNSGPMHLAEALGRPMVVTFAGTELESQWEPRRAPARLLRRPTSCHPCYGFDCPYDLACLDITPAQVLAAAADLLHPAPPIALPAVAAGAG